MDLNAAGILPFLSLSRLKGDGGGSPTLEIERVQ
jgi:hypothetical protein